MNQQRNYSESHNFYHHQKGFNAIALKKKYKYFIISIMVFFSFVFISYKVILTPQFNNYGILKKFINSLNGFSFENRTKVILLWTDFFGDRFWNINNSFINNNMVNIRYFQMHECGQTNCIITNNRSYLSSIELYDALLFHVSEPFGLHEYLPLTRNTTQLYVFSTLESPAHMKHEINDESNVYNITMTYRLDSDILWSYGYIEDIQTNRIVAPSSSPNWRAPTYEHLKNDTELINLIKNKKQFATWFASHCDTFSKREDLVKNLEKYIQIDIYGSCGDLDCPRSSTECDKRLDTNYKFYLSFENSLCTDYVTEKFFRALDHYVIPIVYGGADYMRFAPPYSFINVEDFENVEELARYLLYLDKNPQEYLKYFWWKKFYRTTQRIVFCKLCELLNNEAQYEKIQIYKNIKNWWFKNSCKLTPSITFQ